MSNLLSIVKVAEQLGVHPDTVRRAVKTGRLKAHRVGTQIRILPESVNAYLEQNTFRVGTRRNNQPKQQ